MNYQDENARAIDRWVEEGWEWGRPISHEQYAAALRGEWDVLLTPTKPVPHAWFGELKGKKVLGLASGGGQQIPIFAALGAACTVLDYSPRQLESERMVSEREGYPVQIVRADMTKPLPFADGSFDLIFHPVSNCYVEKVEPIFRECFRVLRPGGVLLGGYDNGFGYTVDEAEERVIYSLPFNPLQAAGGPAGRRLPADRPLRGHQRRRPAARDGHPLLHRGAGGQTGVNILEKPALFYKADFSFFVVFLLF